MEKGSRGKTEKKKVFMPSFLSSQINEKKNFFMYLCQEKGNNAFLQDISFIFMLSLNWDGQEMALEPSK